MLDFTYDIPTKIYFGKHQHKKIADYLKTYHNILLVYGKNSIKTTGLYDTITTELQDNNITYKELSGVQPNPRISSVRTGIQLCRDNNIDFILAVGGGSTIDCAKTISAGVYWPKDPWTMFQNNNETHIKKALPIGCILTLSATGTEMNRNAVITNQDTQEKKAIHTDPIRPQFSILDPTLTYTVSAHQTACGVVDTMSHIFEQYYSNTKEAYLQDRLAESLLLTTIHYGPIALQEPNNYEARANLMWASTLALNGLLTYGKETDWATHGIEHALSALTDVTHAVGLAILTPAWMRHVLTEKTAAKFAEYGRNVWKITEEDNLKAAQKAIKHTQDYFTKSLHMPKTLTDINVKEDQLEPIADKAISNRKIGRYKKLNTQDILEILKDAL